MVEQRQSAMQRIQVGVVGLIVVLLFVSLANMVIDGVADTPQDGSVAGTPTEADSEPMPDEPLAELGVTPVAKEEEKAKTEPPPPSNMQQVPAPTDR